MNAPAAALQSREAAARMKAGPPQLPFVLSVGVTGHRADVLPAGSLDVLRSRIREVLLLIAEAGHALLQKEHDCFAPLPPRMRFVSPIADGADQIAAEVAVDLGWELQAVLPFGRAEYRASLANNKARERFDLLLSRASCVLELPGDKKRLLDAYVNNVRTVRGRAAVSRTVRLRRARGSHRGWPEPLRSACPSDRATPSLPPACRGSQGTPRRRLHTPS